MRCIKSAFYYRLSKISLKLIRITDEALRQIIFFALNIFSFTGGGVEGGEGNFISLVCKMIRAFVLLTTIKKKKKKCG